MVVDILKIINQVIEGGSENRSTLAKKKAAIAASGHDTSQGLARQKLA